ncbi:MAG: CaiB/BaiF CoA-transferase family protein [Myxococcota bacterium]|nr:CaiB/BaiF CoA-transferase family protein [Myxococcota bacterium]
MKSIVADNQPLSGVRVVDLSRHLPGPFCTWYLASLGAEVIRIERPGQGDPTRVVPPFVDGQSVFHASLNRGKASVALDTRRPSGQQALLRLIETADVVVEGFRPGTLDGTGLSPEALVEQFPGLIVASITGFGQTGPLAKEPGHDLNFAGYAGMIAGDGRHEPPILQVADLAGGSLTACIGILAALLARVKTGEGRLLDVSITEGALALMAPHLAMAQAEQRDFRPGMEPLSGGMAAYRVYACRDGKLLCVAPLEPKFWTSFSKTVGKTVVPTTEGLAALFRERDRAEWVERLSGTCITPALGAEEVVQEAHFRARQCFETVLGIDMVCAPFGGKTGTNVPILGQDTERILSELDIPLQRLLEEGVAATPDG